MLIQGLRFLYANPVSLLHAKYPITGVDPCPFMSTCVPLVDKILRRNYRSVPRTGIYAALPGIGKCIASIQRRLSCSRAAVFTAPTIVLIPQPETGNPEGFCFAPPFHVVLALWGIFRLPPCYITPIKPPICPKTARSQHVGICSV